MKRYKKFLGFLIILVTLGVFVYYLSNHPEVIDQLKTVSPLVLLTLLVLYACMLGVLALIYDILLRLLNSRLPAKEQILLTVYSSIVNFFGPLQSGPGFRALYLKKRYGLSLVAYSKVSLLYYAAFAFISGAFIFIGSQPLAQSLGLVIIFGAGILAALYFLQRRGKLTKTVNTRLASFLLLATLTQLLVVSLIYFIEVRAVGAQASFGQVLTYTGAANFALFVSLTPGALGFRESFLLLSQRLHHIDSSVIVSANVLDRGIYVVLLGVLFLVIVSSHARDKLSPETVR